MNGICLKLLINNICHNGTNCIYDHNLDTIEKLRKQIVYCDYCKYKHLKNKCNHGLKCFTKGCIYNHCDIYQTNNKYRKKICLFALNGKECPKDQNCPYEHDPNEIKRRKIKYCKYCNKNHLKIKCKTGTDCAFIYSCIYSHCDAPQKQPRHRSRTRSIDRPRHQSRTRSIDRPRHRSRTRSIDRPRHRSRTRSRKYEDKLRREIGSEFEEKFRYERERLLDQLMESKNELLKSKLKNELRNELKNEVKDYIDAIQLLNKINY